ncbi:MAG: autotransporter-associated beta strand repeat-containing protein [Chthoniobacterales bacterium]|nr:autotransporter-associated beta strand repeat-containing protein [Chthoniobacterales bacterium]
MNPLSKLSRRLLLLLTALGAGFLCGGLHAGSATWSLTPQSGDWYTAANWVPETVPNGPNDVATLNGCSSILNLTFPAGSTTILDSMVIHAAPYYGVTVGDQSSLTFVGRGALLVGSYASDHLIADTGGTITFTGRSSSEAGVYCTGMVSFQDNSASIGNADVYSPGILIFSDQANATGVVNVVNGGAAYFNDDATADNVLLGVYGDGFADISRHRAPGLATRALYADGTIFLGANNLMVITSPLPYDNSFPGTLTDGGTSGGRGGSLTKAGAADTFLILSGSSTYTGGTTVVGGALFIETDSRSTPTGTGDVHVNNGGFGGRGNVQGNVTIGSGTSTPASLLPGKRANGFGRLSIRGALTFASDGTLASRVSSAKVGNGEVSARGVTIINAAQVELTDRNNTKLPTGTVLTLINNTAGTPIVGTFANLPDGGTLTANSNTYQADYEGGDGNDLTLTVIN